MKEHRVTLGDIELAVFAAGAGPPVLLLHGFPDDGEVRENQLSALAVEVYRVITPDTRGCGQSTIPAGVSDYRLKFLLDGIISVLDHFELERVSLVAHDWGAMIAWRLVIARPERFERFAALAVGHPAPLGAGGTM
ncbi:MAG: alpha/beta fold hydrolase [Roseibium sp.]